MVEYPKEIASIIKQEALKDPIGRDLPHAHMSEYGEYYAEETRQVTGTVYCPRGYSFGRISTSVVDLLIFPNARIHVHQYLKLQKNIEGELRYMERVFLFDYFA